MRSWLHRAKSDCATCSPARLKGSSETRPAPTPVRSHQLQRKIWRCHTYRLYREKCRPFGYYKLTGECLTRGCTNKAKQWAFMGGTAAPLMTSWKDRDKKKNQVANSGRLLQWVCNMLRLLRVEWHPQMFFTCPAWMDSLCLFAWESSSRRQPNPHHTPQLSLPNNFTRATHPPTSIHRCRPSEKPAILKDFNMHETKVGGRKVQKRIRIKRLLGGNV